MKNDWNGDSFDLVKRFWRDIFSPIAKLYSHQRFFRDAYLNGQDRLNYESLTKIRITNTPQTSPFAWLLDPDTGICDFDSPTDKDVGKTRAKATAEHTTLGFVADLFQSKHPNLPKFVAVFDQSKPRRKGLSPYQHRMNKLHAFKKSKIGCQLHYFYYISHAPFLFCSNNLETLSRVRALILKSGIPEHIPNKNKVLEVRVTPIV